MRAQGLRIIEPDDVNVDEIMTIDMAPAVSEDGDMQDMRCELRV